MLRILFLFIACSVSYAQYEVKIELDKSDGIYRSGEIVKGMVKVFSNKTPVNAFSGKYQIVFEKQVLSTKEAEIDDNPLILEHQSDVPGWVYFSFELTSADGKAVDGDKKILGEAGAIFDPDRIVATDSMPEDFVAYWQKFRKELDKVPVKAKLEPVELPEKYKGKMICQAVTVDCLSKHPVTGYLMAPADHQGKKLPAFVLFQSHMMTDCYKALGASIAMRNAIVLQITWHGLPVNQPKDFYVKTLRSKDYYPPADGDREGPVNAQILYWHDVFMRVMRALDYIKTRPEWNGIDLIIKGGSLGGAQAIAAAALESNVTIALVDVPAFCELQAWRKGRQTGFRGVPAALLKDERAAKAMAYYDGVNFARLIRCPIYVCTGFTDNICYPSNVLAFYNAIPQETEKYLTTNPYTGHGGQTYNLLGEKCLDKFFRERASNR